MKNAVGMRGARVTTRALVAANLLWLGAFAAGQNAVPANGGAAVPTQRASGLDESLTLLEVVGALAAADRSTGPVGEEEMLRLEKYIRDAPNDIRPLVAEDTLRLKKDSLWPRMVQRSFIEWARIDGEAATKRVASNRRESIDDAKRRQTAFGVTCQVWMQRQPDRYWAWLLNEYPDELYRGTLTVRFVEWRALNDLPATVKMLPEIKDPAARESAMDEIAWKWGEKDPRAALAWVDSLGDSVNPYRLTERLVLGLTSKDKAAGAALAMSLPDVTMRNNLVNRVHEIWSNHDVKAAVRSFLKLPTDLQYSATGSVFGFNTEKLSVEEILAMDRELALVKDVRIRFLAGAVARRRDAKKMEESLLLLKTLDAGPERRDGMKALATRWASLDFPAASAWVQSLQEGEEKEAAIEGTAWGLLETDPLRALSWCERLNGEGAAGALRADLVFNWWLRDESRARQWLAQTDTLTEKEKVKVLKDTETGTLLLKLK